MSTAILLTMPYGSLMNCLSIQPIFYENNKIEQSYLGFVYRTAAHRNREGTMRFMIKSRIGEENNEILNNKFHISEASKRIINFLANNCFLLQHNTSLDVLMKNDDLLKETLKYYLKRIELYISVGCGNFIITSRKDLYHKKILTAADVQNLQMFLVDENVVPRDVIIIGHKNLNVFCNPYVLCPLIDKNHFNEICYLNGINIDSFNNINHLDKYPLIEKHLNLYSLYQSYLDNVEVPYWYIEQFNNPTTTKQKSYYTLIKFG